MRFKNLSALWLIMLCTGLAAQKIDMQKWRTQTSNSKTGNVQITAQQIKLTRSSQYPDKAMLRAFQDVTVTPDTVYLLSYEIKVAGGKGGGRATVYFGSKAGKWTKQRAYAPNMRQCDFTPIKLTITAGSEIVKLRIDLRAFGKNTTITYRNIKLEKLKKQGNLVLTPTDKAVTLDGKLNDPIWENALTLTPFRVLGAVKKVTGVDNKVKLAVKNGYLYIGYQLEEPQLQRMKISSTSDVSEMENPIRIAQDDCVETFFTTDKKSFSHLIVNPVGVKYWEQVNVGQPAQTWYPTQTSDFTGDWVAKANIGNKGWSVEMRVKLSSIFGAHPGGRQTLFANFTRHRPHTAEPNQTWAPIAGKKYKALDEFPAITINLPATKRQQQYKNLIQPKFTKRFSIPQLLLAGKPIKISLKNGEDFQLASNVTVKDATQTVKADVKKLLAKALTCNTTSSKLDIELRLQKNFLNSQDLTAAERKKLKSPEAFKLELQPNKAVISSSTREGVLRGIATLVLMANRVRFLPDRSIPALTMYDAPRMAFRGWLITHPNEKVKQMIDLAFLLRFNKIFISLHSFRGPTRFPFACYPIGNKRYTKQHWIDIFNYARARGIEPIPYFSPWGRNLYLKTMPGGEKFFVEDKSVKKNNQVYRNLDVANPEAVKLALALQQEIIDILKPKGFCIAMDEIHFGNTVTSAAAKAKHWKPSDWFVNAIKYSHQLFKRNNIKLYIWGDMIDPGYNGRKIDMCGKALMDRLPKDIVIIDWKYDGRKNYDVDFPSIKMFKDGGFKTLGAPWYKAKNIPRMIHAVVKHNADGICLTSWSATPIDQLKPELIRSLGLMAYYSWSPEDCNLKNLSLLPDVLVHAAAYWNKVDYPATNVLNIDYTSNLVNGNELAQLLGFPEGNSLDFLTTKFKNYRNVSFKPFINHNQPAAVVVPGNNQYYQGWVKNGNFTRGLKDWLISNRTDGSIATEQQHLAIKAPSDNAFMRAFQDIKLNLARQYTLHCRVKVKGTGYGRVWAYLGDNKFNWDSKKMIFANIKAQDWADCTLKLPAKGGSVRISFSARGSNTTAWFDDVRLEVAAKDSESIIPAPKYTIPINHKTAVITFMHAVNPQLIDENFITMWKRFKDIIPGRYIVNYVNGKKVAIPLIYRDNICAINDPTLGVSLDLGLFGTVGRKRFVNLPTFTWENPFPKTKIKSIDILPGNSATMSLLLFSISLN